MDSGLGRGTLVRALFPVVLEAGSTAGDPCIEKPFSIEDLIRSVDRVCEAADASA